MAIQINGKDIKGFRHNGKYVTAVYKGSTKIWPGEVECYVGDQIWRDFDASMGTLSLATGKICSFTNTTIGDHGMSDAFYGCIGLTGSVSFPLLTSIGNYGLYEAFRECYYVDSVSFPVLETIGTFGLRSAFRYCNGLTEVVYFPKLTSIDTNGLTDAFYDCSLLPEVHFPAALSGNSECTVSNMGCSNTIVYFDL